MCNRQQLMNDDFLNLKLYLEKVPDGRSAVNLKYMEEGDRI